MWAAAIFAFVAGLTTWPALTGTPLSGRDKPVGAGTQIVAANAQAVKDQQAVTADLWEQVKQARADCQKAQAELQSLRAAQERAKDEVIRSAQMDCAMAGFALLAIPVDKRSDEVNLALECIQSADAALAAAIGKLPEDQQQHLAAVVTAAISKNVEARKAAEAEIAHLHESLSGKIADLRVAQAQLDAQQKIAALTDAAANQKVEKYDAANKELQTRVTEAMGSLQMVREKHQLVMRAIDILGTGLIAIALFVVVGRRMVQTLPSRSLRAVCYHVNRPILAVLKWVAEWWADVTIVDNVRSRIEAEKSAGDK